MTAEEAIKKYNVRLQGESLVFDLPGSKDRDEDTRLMQEGLRTINFLTDPITALLRQKEVPA